MVPAGLRGWRFADRQHSVRMFLACLVCQILSPFPLYELYCRAMLPKGTRLFRGALVSAYLRSKVGWLIDGEAYELRSPSKKRERLGNNSFACLYVSAYLLSFLSSYEMCRLCAG